MNKSISERERFRSFVQGNSAESVIPFPIYKTASVAYGLGRDWATDVTYEECRDFMRGLNCIPSVTLGEREWFPEDHPLSLRPRLVEQSENQRDYRASVKTPTGEMTIPLAEFKHQSLTLSGGPGQEPADLEKVLLYIRAVREDTAAIRQQVIDVRKRVGEDCLIVFFLPQPYELYCIFNREDAFFLEMDYPELFAQLQAEILKTVKSVIQPASEGGADLFFFGSAGTEIYSPDIFRNHILEPSIEYAQIVREAGGISTFHLCGHGKEFLDMGVFNQMKPDIVEGLGTSNTGNIPSLEYARERVPASTILRGNIPLSALRDGSPDALHEACHAIIKSQQGSRHILSGECDILYGTPAKNIKTIAEACL